MQEKSSVQIQQQWKSPVDFFIDYIRRHDDFVVGAGLGLSIGVLMGLTIITCILK